MNSREKLQAAVHHQPGKIAFDLGSNKATGINASLLYRLRKSHGRDEPVKVYDTYQMLGLIDETDAKMFGLDVIGIWNRTTCFGYHNTDWKKWTLPDGTPGLVGSDCEMSVDAEGTTYIYPQGNRSVPPSGRQPANGHYFDQIARQREFDEDALDALADYDEQFALYDDETLDDYRRQAEHYSRNTDLGIVLNAECAAFGAATQILGPMLLHPTGVRDIGEFLMAHHLYPEYVKAIFALQAERAIGNLTLLWQAVGSLAQVVFISSTDFGTQRGLTLSRDMFREFYFPYYKQVNDWIHANTAWKILYHSCGAIGEIIGDFCDAGVDALNPIQCEACGMDPKKLKADYGSRLTFWGAGVDSQSTMAEGTADDVERQMRERIEICSPGGGFVFSIVHNVQANISIDKLDRVFDVLREYR